MVRGHHRLHAEAVSAVRFRREARAGLYAHAKYEKGLRAYRKRLRLPLIVVATPLFIFYVAVWIWHGGGCALTGRGFLAHPPGLQLRPDEARRTVRVSP